MIEINYRDLTPETLRNLLREVVLREGTEYGDVHYSTEQKVEQLLLALQDNKARIMFDAELGFCDVVSR